MSSVTSRAMIAALGRYVRAPFRALVRARDLYVTRMAALAGAGGRRGPVVGLVAVPRSRSHGFYRSASADNDVDDLRELIRAGASRTGRPAGVGPRSRSSVAIVGRIDEDRPCEFGLEEDRALGPRRSRSCAVGRPTERTAARGAGVAVAVAA